MKIMWISYNNANSKRNKTKQKRTKNHEYSKEKRVVQKKNQENLILKKKQVLIVKIFLTYLLSIFSFIFEAYLLKNPKV